MLCELLKSCKSCPRAGLLPILFLNFLAIAWGPIASAQVSDFDRTGGEISGTVLLDADSRPANQVVVNLRAYSAGVFRSVLTDRDGQFEVRALPLDTYEINVEEPGYESARTSAKLDGPFSKLVLRLKPSKFRQTPRNAMTVSVSELKIPHKARDEYEKGLQLLAKDPVRSLGHLSKAAQVFPNYYEAYYHMGVVMMKLGRKDEASEDFQKAIDLSGGLYAWAEFGIGYLLCLDGKPGEAEPIIRRGLELDNTAPEGYGILGIALLQLNRPEEAERSAHEAILRNSNFAIAYLVLSDVYARRQSYRAQLQDLDTYLRLEPVGSESDRVRQAREEVLRILSRSNPQD
jgi:tetratricopeptide (TPR) repeat protein